MPHTAAHNDAWNEDRLGLGENCCRVVYLTGTFTSSSPVEMCELSELSELSLLMV
jgi:hypothetical protein